MNYNIRCKKVNIVTDGTPEKDSNLSRPSFEDSVPNPLAGRVGLNRIELFHLPCQSNKLPLHQRPIMVVTGGVEPPCSFL